MTGVVGPLSVEILERFGKGVLVPEAYLPRVSGLVCPLLFFLGTELYLPGPDRSYFQKGVVMVIFL
jgi:hypothetical protein